MIKTTKQDKTYYNPSFNIFSICQISICVSSSLYSLIGTLYFPPKDRFYQASLLSNTFSLTSYAFMLLRVHNKQVIQLLYNL